MLDLMIVAIVVIGVTTCSINATKETDRQTAFKCFEQTKSEKCWEKR